MGLLNRIFKENKKTSAKSQVDLDKSEKSKLTVKEREERAKDIIRTRYKERVMFKEVKSESEIKDMSYDELISYHNSLKNKRMEEIFENYNKMKKEQIPEDLIEARIFKNEQKDWTHKYFMEYVNKPLQRKIREFEKDIIHSKTYKGKLSHTLGKPNYTRIYSTFNQEEIEKLKNHENKDLQEIGQLLESYNQLLNERKEIDIEINEIDSKIQTEEYLEIMKKYNDNELSEEELLGMYPKIHRKRNMEMLEIHGVPYTPIIQKFISSHPKSFISEKPSNIDHHLESYSVNKHEAWVNEDDNLVALTNEEHDEFHKIYGNRNNTRSQFNEYLDSKGIDPI